MTADASDMAPADPLLADVLAGAEAQMKEMEDWLIHGRPYVKV